MAYDFLDLLTAVSDTEPVSFKEFIQSPEFCGETELYDFWLNQEVNSGTSELILDGSLGGGKSTYAAFRIVYFIYTLFNRGPKLRKWLGVAENSPVYILYFSVSMTQAKRSGFQQIINIVDQCKWFEKNYPRDKRIDSEVRFPNDFSIVYASGETHQISLNIVAFILDEANFRKGVGKGMAEEYNQVTQLYSQLIDRQITRFASRDGMKSLAILISSASYQTSFVEERKVAVRNDEHTQIITSVGYKIKPHLYSKEMFEVFVGTEVLNPQIIEGQEQKNTLMRAVGADQYPELESQYFVKVPVSIKKPFMQHIDLALQNHCGIPTQIQGRLVKNLGLVRDSYYEQDKPWFPNYQVELSSSDDVELIDYLTKSNIEHPELPHYFFLDLSLRNDSGGFTCVRDDSEINPHESGQKNLTHIFTLEIVPPPFPASTKIRKMFNFMVDIAQIVNVQGFATDQYQSAGLRQDIHSELDLPDVRISIDSSDQVYLLWLSMLVDKRFKMLMVPTLHREIKEAVHDLKRRRVVKAPNSTDDCIQSLVGAVYLAEVSEAISLDLPTNIVGDRAVRRLAKSLGYK